MKRKIYRAIDLFCGCGGISVGFADSGRVKMIGAIDFDQAACNTYQLNFPDTHVICGDINQISVESTGFKDIDFIVGGPPCQGFSRLNFHDKDRDNDPRNKLFYQYLRFVEELQPKAILIENVKNILVAKDGFAPKAITSILDELGYNVSYAIVCAVDFGVPQKRERAIFIALKKEYGVFDFASLEKYSKDQVTVYEAISDIAAIEDIARLQKPGSILKLGEPTSEYQILMQREDRLLENHLIYYPDDSVQKKISHVPQGGNWRYVPKELFPSDRSNRYTNYLRRLDYSVPSITIDTGHRVYFHPTFNRVPTVRESARIQSFSDSFIITGTKGQQLKQVGNAVPPLMAKALAKAIIDNIEKKK